MPLTLAQPEEGKTMFREIVEGWAHLCRWPQPQRVKEVPFLPLFILTHLDSQSESRQLHG